MIDLIIPPHIARELGRAACAQLEEWGESPRSLSVVDDGGTVVIGFEIITDEPRWRRTVEVKAAHCNPAFVHSQLNAWREKLRGDIRNGNASPTVRDAIQCFGAEAVAKALEHRAHG